MERSQGLWKLLHGPHSYNSMVTWKTSWAKDYRLESEKLNHNGIYVTQDNVLLKQNKTLFQEIKTMEEGKLGWYRRQHTSMLEE